MNKSNRKKSASKVQEVESQLMFPCVRALTAPGCISHEVALTFDRQLTFDECTSLNDQLLVHLEAVRKAEGRLDGVRTKVLMRIGDFLNHAENSLGDDYAQLIDPHHYATETIRNAAWVASRVPIVNRREGIAFGIYQAIAKLDHEKQAMVIADVEKLGLSISDVRRVLSEAKEKADKSKKAEKAPPVKALETLNEFASEMKSLVEELPVDSWDADSVTTIKAAFDSAVLEIKETYGWL